MESDDYFLRSSDRENSDNSQLQAHDGDPLSSLFAKGNCIAENTQSIMDNILESTESESDCNIEQIEEVFVLANDFLDDDILHNPYSCISSGSNGDDDMDTSYDISHIYGHMVSLSICIVFIIYSS